jgi:YegS/Rv2252/BmrU family lipid kinase
MAEAALAACHAEGEVWLTEGPGHALELARAAVVSRATLVCAWGGDGTVNEVASALAGSGTALGIVPAGSGNGLARQLGISRQPADAIRQAIAAEPRRIDVGELGDRFFVNTAGLGFDAHVARCFNQSGSGRRGLLTYTLLTARSLMTYRPSEYVIATADSRVRVRAVIVTAANSAEFGNGACIAPGARVDDGLLDLVIVEERWRLQTIASLPRLFNGTVGGAPGCSIRRVTRATIESERPMTFHVDGEPAAGGTSLLLRIHPGALNVCVRAG